MPHDPSLYSYASPLPPSAASLPPLPTTLNPDGKSFVNPPSSGKSQSYTSFPAPITNSQRGGFDVHVYYLAHREEQRRHAEELWKSIRYTFPELRVYRLWDRAVGPHPVPMFEVNLFTPEQYGAFIPWLLIHRGPLSALVHPNTDDEERDHTQHAVWLGERFPLDTTVFGRTGEYRVAMERVRGAGEGNL